MDVGGHSTYYSAAVRILFDRVPGRELMPAYAH